jgi:hypothetical protein
VEKEEEDGIKLSWSLVLWWREMKAAISTIQTSQIESEETTSIWRTQHRDPRDMNWHMSEEDAGRSHALGAGDRTGGCCSQVGCGGSRNVETGTDRVKPLMRFNGSMSWTVFVASLRPWRDTTNSLGECHGAGGSLPTYCTMSLQKWHTETLLRHSKLLWGPPVSPGIPFSAEWQVSARVYH